MTSSESPTHPDAPRAGGETPAVDLEATRRLLAKIERDYRDSAYACDASSFGSLGATRRRIADDLAQLRAALPSLLERHRDGERDTEAKFRQLAALKRDWDGYGADRIWPSAIETARRLVTAFAKSPDIVPVCSGGLQLEWANGEIEIDISPEGEVEGSVEIALSSTPHATPPAASPEAEA